MPVDAALRSSFRFMLENCGYSIPPGRAVCALNLARAEVAGRDLECDHDEPRTGRIRWRWEWDEFPDRESAGDVGCILERYDELCGWTHLESLWGISESFDIKTRHDYRRLVEAELALKAGFGQTSR